MIGFQRLIVCRRKRSDIYGIAFGELVTLRKGSVVGRESVPYWIIQQAELVLLHDQAAVNESSCDA